jgi:hypothetical protein
MEHVVRDMEAYQNENRGLREELEERSGRADSLQALLEEKRALLDDMTANLESQREVAEANLMAKEAEIATLNRALDALRASAAGVAGDLDDFSEEMRNGANELSGLVHRLRGIIGHDQSPRQSMPNVMKPSSAPPSSWDYAQAEEPLASAPPSDKGNGVHHDDAFAEFTFPESPDSVSSAPLDDDDPSI